MKNFNHRPALAQARDYHRFPPDSGGYPTFPWRETMKYLFLAYTIFWIFLFAYLFRLSRKQKRLEEEIKNLKNEANTKSQMPISK